MRYVVNRYCLIKNPAKKRKEELLLVVVCAPVVCRPAAVVHCNLSALAHLVRSLAHALVAAPSQSVFLLPRPKKKRNAPRSFWY